MLLRSRAVGAYVMLASHFLRHGKLSYAMSTCRIYFISPLGLREAQPKVGLCNAAVSLSNEFCQINYLHIYGTDIR